jgi:hypothetical protein
MDSSRRDAKQDQGQSMSEQKAVLSCNVQMVEQGRNGVVLGGEWE